MNQAPGAVIITEETQLADLVRELKSESILAFDTESDGMYSYKEKVCLIQVSSKTRDYIIDPLSIADLSLLGEIFAAPSIEKIFHDAEYDLICLIRDYAFKFTNIFDTMIAAKILGVEEVGLGGLINREYGIIANKKYQRANWGRRPLSPEMLEYARMDTHYLIPLRNKLRRELQTRGLLQIAQEDFRVACMPEIHTVTLEEYFWKTKGLRYLNKRAATVLWQLFVYRDKIASSRDMPAYKVLSNSILMDLAKACPGDIMELKKITGMSSYNIKKHGVGILEAIKLAGTSNPPEKPENNIDDKDFYYRLDRLKRWRTRTARRAHISSEVVLSRKLSHKLALENPADKNVLRKLMADTPSRYERYGSAILELLKTC